MSGLLGVGLGLLILIWPQALSVIAAFFMMISGFILLSFYRKSRDFFGAVREMDRFGRD
ncbi:MAG TPA: hypothetical protein PKL97_01195 [Candidatus Omnitrophota bacterium]|nr:hypothetical protein [Candidatus Omnitrophota bacterium]